MASAVWGGAPWWGPPPPAPARPLTDIDFCSGAQLQELTQLIQELGVQESWSNGPKPGPDLLQAKDFVFSLLSLIHRRDPRFPPQAELLLLRGGIREGSLDLGSAPLGPYARGPHYDAGFTLLVPVFSLDATGPELQLDLESCYAWLHLPELVRGASVREEWKDCLGPPVPGGCDSIHRNENEESPKDQPSFADQLYGYVTEPEPQVSLEKSPSDVSGPESPRRDVTDLGSPAPLKTLSGDVTKPAVPGRVPKPSEAREVWPTLCPAQVAAWFFASLAAVAEALIPVPGAPRLVHAARHGGFTTNPPGHTRAHAAAQALLRPLVAGTRAAAPYMLRTLLYWACERLPALYLARPENAGACCLGLLDELGRVLEAGALPHYFLSGRKLRAGDSAAALLEALTRLRGDPARALRVAVEEAKAARKGGGLAGVGGGAH
nr:transmembrane protein 102 [Loxodonta africana]